MACLLYCIVNCDPCNMINHILCSFCNLNQITATSARMITHSHKQERTTRCTALPPCIPTPKADHGNSTSPDTGKLFPCVVRCAEGGFEPAPPTHQSIVQTAMPIEQSSIGRAVAGWLVSGGYTWCVYQSVLQCM